MAKTKEPNIVALILSVILAVGLWMFIRVSVNPDDSRTLRNLPVTITGLETLENRGLMVTTGGEQTATIRVAGKLDALSAIAADPNTHITITVDLSSVEQPGQYTRNVQVSFNLSGIPTSSSVALIDRYPSSLSYTVVREAKRTVPVRGNLAGSVAEGYQMGEFAFSPASVEVRGVESLVNQVDYALVTLNEENMTSSYGGELPFSLVTFTGGTVQSNQVVTDVSLIYTALPVVQLKEVPLTVNLISGGGATEENADVTITPASVVVSGTPADLEPLKELSLGSIDLAKILGSDTRSFPINLSSELTNVSGVAEATVKVEITGLTTMSLETDNIELLHIPTGYTAQTVTKTRQIQIRGAADAVKEIAPSQLRIVADLENAITATGSQTVPVRVYLDGRSDVGVVGDYSIVISVTRS